MPTIVRSQLPNLESISLTFLRDTTEEHGESFILFNSLRGNLMVSGTNAQKFELLDRRLIETQRVVGVQYKDSNMSAALEMLVESIVPMTIPKRSRQ